MSSNKEIKYGSVLSYSTVVFNFIVGIIYTPWMVNTLGETGYSIYSVATSVIGYIIIDLGIGYAVSRHVSNSIAQKKDDINDYLGVALKINVIAALLISLVLAGYFVLIPYINTAFVGNEVNTLKLAFSLVAFNSVIIFAFSPVSSVLNGSERFIFGRSVDLICRILTIGSSCVVLYLGYGVIGLAVTNYIFIIIGSVVKSLYMVFVLKIKPSLKSGNKQLYKSVMLFSFWATVVVICDRFALNVMPTILSNRSDKTQVALFAVALSLEGMVWSISNAINGLFLPKVTRILNSPDRDANLLDFMIKVGKLQAVIVGVIISGFFLIGKEFLLVWMKDSMYIDAYWPILLIITPLFFTMTQDIARTALIAENKVKYRALAYFITVVVCLLIAIPMARVYGAFGVALAIFISNIIGKTFVMGYVYWKKLNINMGVFYMKCYLRIIVPVLLTVCTGLLINNFITLGGYFGIILKATIIGIVYLILVIFIYLTKEEREYYRKVIQR